jgi:hypothetical protein
MKLKEYINHYQIPEQEFITINNFLGICDYVYNPQIRFIEEVTSDNKASNMNGAKIIKKVPKENSIIMCRVRKGEILELFNNCKKNKNNKYIVIQQSIMDDGRIDKKILETMPNNVIKLYAKHVEVLHERITSIPIGRDFRNKVAYQSVKLNSETRTFKNLLYCNFAINTNKENRLRIYNLFRHKNWVTQVEVEEWMKYPISREEYIKQVHSHKFCLSPEGAGIDCFRTWEALYIKSIPIVQESIHMNAFKDLPILFTKDYSEITKIYLEEKYEEMLETDYNIEKLHFSCWKHLIMKDKNLFLENKPKDNINFCSGKKLTSVLRTIKNILKGKYPATQGINRLL